VAITDNDGADDDDDADCGTFGTTGGMTTSIDVAASSRSLRPSMMALPHGLPLLLPSPEQRQPCHSWPLGDCLMCSSYLS
jgi:hypothetical protein